MITKHGIVMITENKLEASSFAFDCGGTLTQDHCTNLVIDWAIERLEAERIPIASEDQRDTDREGQ